MITEVEIIGRLLAAAVLGAVIGTNRSRLDWAAGLRTHMLVSVGAALAMIVSAYGFGDVLGQPHVVLDPSRIAAQVISGIGFLGAGTILFMQREQIIRGLTTAAGLWAVAAVGLAAGAGLYFAAFVATALLWIILAILKPLERRFIRPRRKYTSLKVGLSREVSLSAVEKMLTDLEAPVQRMLIHRHANGEDTFTMRFDNDFPAAKLTVIADACRDIEGVTSVSVTVAGRLL